MTDLLRAPIALLVLGYQSLVLALAQIWANKTRSILTTIGIVIGVASVTAVIAALSGLKKNVLTEFEAFGTNKVFVWPSRPDSGRYKNAPRSVIWFQPEEFDGMLDHCPSLKSFTRETNTSLTVTYNDRSDPEARVTGIEPSWHQIENRTVTLGRPFSLIDNTQGRPVCLINSKLQDKLGLPRDCTGTQIIVGDRRYQVVGIVESRSESSMFGENSSGSEVFVPFKTLYNSLRGRTIPTFVMVVAASKSPEVSDEAQAEMNFFLRRRRHLEIGDPDTFHIEYVGKFVDQFKSVASAITMVATGIVGVSLLVGGVGIMNIMLVSVSERTREIGLRKAVGARPAAIMLQFLVEAVSLCLFGGLIGLLGGQALTSLMASIPTAKLDKAYIPGWAVALSFGFAASVGLIFGMFPAIKAARLDPIEALRHE